MRLSDEKVLVLAALLLCDAPFFPRRRLVGSFFQGDGSLGDFLVPLPFLRLVFILPPSWVQTNRPHGYTNP